jgi:hypothetical protein
MAEAISNTSPIFYLHQAGALDWLARLFSDVWIPSAVVQELAVGKRQGCDVPDLKACPWARVHDPQRLPSEWLALDLGPGELSALTLALEHPQGIVLSTTASPAGSRNPPASRRGEHSASCSKARNRA